MQIPGHQHDQVFVRLQLLHVRVQLRRKRLPAPRHPRQFAANEAAATGDKCHELHKGTQSLTPLRGPEYPLMSVLAGSEMLIMARSRCTMLQLLTPDPYAAGCRGKTQGAHLRRSSCFASQSPCGLQPRQMPVHERHLRG